MSTTTYIIIMAVCLLLSAYFSATETAFSSANITRLKTRAEKGNSRAALACKLLERYDKLQQYCEHRHGLSGHGAVRQELRRHGRHAVHRGGDGGGADLR